MGCEQGERELIKRARKGEDPHFMETMRATRYLPDALETWRRRGESNLGTNGRRGKHGGRNLRTKKGEEC